MCVCVLFCWESFCSERSPPPQGIVPVDYSGNVDARTPALLPEGTVHIPSSAAAAAAKFLQVDFAHAFVGFERAKGRPIPKLQGIVVCEEFADMVRAASDQVFVQCGDLLQAQAHVFDDTQWHAWHSPHSTQITPIPLAVSSFFSSRCPGSFPSSIAVPLWLHRPVAKSRRSGQRRPPAKPQSDGSSSSPRRWGACASNRENSWAVRRRGAQWPSRGTTCTSSRWTKQRATSTSRPKCAPSAASKATLRDGNSGMTSGWFIGPGLNCIEHAARRLPGQQSSSSLWPVAAPCCCSASQCSPSFKSRERALAVRPVHDCYFYLTHRPAAA